MIRSLKKIKKDILVYKEIIENSHFHRSQKNWNEISTRKKSDTLCVLATGPSINDLSDLDLKFISEHDSIAINLFICHDFIPTYHQIEFWPQYKDLFLKLFGEKYHSNKEKAPLLIINKVHAETSKLDYKELFEFNYLITNPLRFTGYSLKDIERYLINYKKYFHLLFSNLFFHHGGSLTCALSLGLILNYKKIIIYGTNLNKRGHFYSDHNLYNDRYSNEFDRISKQIEKEIISRVDSSSLDTNVHPTINQNLTQTYNEHSVFEIIKILKKIASVKNQNIYVFNNDSALSAILDVYEY